MKRARQRAVCRPAAALALLSALAWGVAGAQAQEAPARLAPPDAPRPPTGGPDEAFEGRPIAQVRLERPVAGQPGITEPLDPATAQIVRNNIRSLEGTEFHADLVIADAKLLNRLERFKTIEHRVQPLTDGSVAVIFTLVERAVIEDIQAVGNHMMSDRDIRDIADKLMGTAVNDQVIDGVAREIEGAYRKKGYYRVQVSADQAELAETGILYFRVREGERLRVTDIRFTAVEGDLVFRPGELRDAIKTTTYRLLFKKGLLDEDQLDLDVKSVADYYRDRGYLDVQADRKVTEAPNGREAIVEFLIVPGRRYVLRNVVAYYPDLARFYKTQEEALAAMGPNEHFLVDDLGRLAVYPTGLYSAEQLAGLIEIKSGDVYSADKLDRGDQIIRDAYGKQGYTDALRADGRGIVERHEKPDQSEPFVDLVYEVHEGPRFKTGAVPIQGNSITRDSVVRREVEVLPDHPLDTTAVQQTESNLRAPRGAKLFSAGPPYDSGRAPTVTLQDEDPANPGYRDALVEVEETNTGEFNLGGGISSDSGVFATVNVTQRNFDIGKPPDSWAELFSGRAFRGGGQTVSVTASPGTQFQTYSVRFVDPAVADSNFGLSLRGSYEFKSFDQYDEERFGGQARVSRVIGSRWTSSLTLRNEWTALHNLKPDSPTDFFQVADLSRITGLELSISRTSVPRNERYVPTRGNKVEAGVEQVGILGGEFDFTKLRAAYSVYLPVFETFYGKTTVLSFNGRVNYIPQDAGAVPTYERYYLGGQDFRGFSLRAISPRGVRNDTGGPSNVTVGGTWSIFGGLELRQPVPFAPDTLSVVAFMDTGTVLDHPGFDQYRVSVGLGLRVLIPQLSPVPLAFDFGYPILREDGDNTRLFTFSIDVPFDR